MITDIFGIADSQLDSFLAAEQALEDKAFQAAGNPMNDEEDQSRLIQFIDNISVIEIKGYLTNSNSWLNRYFGMVSYDEIREAAIQAQDNSEAVLFHIGSPGGRVPGLADVSNFVSSMSIPTVTFTDSQMASAALFLGIQMDHVYGDSFSEVGSVGVILQWLDRSGYLKQNGITPMRFRSGDLKASPSANFKLSSKESAYIKEQISTYAEKFYAIVSEGRGIPRPMLDELNITSGRTFIGEQAEEVGLVDSILTFDQAVLKTAQLAQKSLDKGGRSTVLLGH